MVKIILNSFLFWGGWIIIPFIMEIVPALGSVFLLIRRNLRHKIHKKELTVYPEITLIIPVYNSADTLYGCIKSINDSTYPNERIRIFLVNNKGKDNSFDIFAKCQQEFPDLLMQWMNSEQGKSRALNLALYNSEGKYIINLDSDGMLEKSALANMITRFENDTSINCMTGSILTVPEQIKKYKAGPSRLLRELEFMEYAQAFLAGRNYSAEINAVYTLSGAFSAFRKSVVLKSQLYNTDTICEDTQITFQMKYLLKTKVGICEDAIFFVDPIEDLNKLYTQRQRWQRGSLEVSHLFLKNKLKIRNMFTNVGVRTLVYDHTFAFPRLIWYLALICLMCLNYSFAQVGYSTLFLYLLYVLIGFFYYISTVGFLKNFKEIRKYYAKQWYVLPLLPLFNLAVFFIRFAGVVNSINTNSAWKTKNFTQEKDSLCKTITDDFAVVMRFIRKVRAIVNKPEEHV